MEYFEYVQIPQYLMQFLRGGSGGISLGELYILLGVAGGAYLFCLILGGLALYVMAERAGVKHSWLGFIPFANTYYAGQVAGETSFFGKRMKRAGLYAMLAEIVYVALETFSLIASILIANPGYYETNYIEGNPTLSLDLNSVPAGLRWMVSGSTWFSVLGLVANLAMLVLMCAIYMALFRKYSPRNSFILTIVSVLLPVRAFVLFSVRNRLPVDYGEYMQQRLEQVMRSAGVEMRQDETQQGNPFSDFSNKPSSPFEEFDVSSPFDFPNGPDDGSDSSDNGNGSDE